MTKMLTTPRDPRGKGDEVRAVDLERVIDRIVLALAKGQDYGENDGNRDPHDFRHRFADTDGINWFHRTMSVSLDAPTARWLATELNGLAAAIESPELCGDCGHAVDIHDRRGDTADAECDESCDTCIEARRDFLVERQMQDWGTFR